MCICLNVCEVGEVVIVFPVAIYSTTKEIGGWHQVHCHLHQAFVYYVWKCECKVASFIKTIKDSNGILSLTSGSYIFLVYGIQASVGKAWVFKSMAFAEGWYWLGAFCWLHWSSTLCVPCNGITKKMKCVRLEIVLGIYLLYWPPLRNVISKRNIWYQNMILTVPGWCSLIQIIAR